MKPLIALSVALILGVGVRAQDASKPAAKGPPADTARLTEKPIANVAAQLKDKDPKVRRAAAQELGRRGVKAVAAVPALTEALSDSIAQVQTAAAEALGGIGVTAKSAVPKLIEALKDKDAMVRETAAEALADIRVEPEKVIP